jgi:hypothetical protein
MTADCLLRKGDDFTGDRAATAAKVTAAVDEFEKDDDGLALVEGVEGVATFLLLLP